MADAETTPFDHVVVLGAGAVGSVYAATLSARNDVTLVGRPSHVDAIAKDGLRLVGAETMTTYPRATTALAAIAPRTLLLLTTKVKDSRAAMAGVVDVLRPDTVVLCVQNGLQSEAIVKEVVGDRCLVLRAITNVGAIFKAPGVIDFKVAGYTLVERSALSGAIAGLLDACDLKGRVTDEIKVEIWRKLIFNCVINPITSMLGTDVGSIADTKLDPLKRLVIDECLRVARADG